MQQWPPPSQAIDFEAYQRMLRERPDLRGDPGGLGQRMASERVMLVGWARAILMQLAHRLIAAGVAQHSYSGTSAAEKLRRFHRTLDSFFKVTFGTPREVWEAAQAIDAIHDRVHGQAHLPDGRVMRYSARQPELLRWVHYTFVDSSLVVYRRFIGPIADHELEPYLMQASVMAPLLGAPLGYFPDTPRRMEEYGRQMLAGGELLITDDARRVAANVLAGLPSASVIGTVTNTIGRHATVELLPEPIQRLYGFHRRPTRHLLVRGLTAAHRLGCPFFPNRLRYWQVNAEMGA